MTTIYNFHIIVVQLVRKDLWHQGQVFFTTLKRKKLLFEDGMHKQKKSWTWVVITFVSITKVFLIKLFSYRGRKRVHESKYKEFGSKLRVISI